MIEIILSFAVSAHLGFSERYNNTHPRLGVEYENIIAGVYYNSEYDISSYVGYEFKIQDNFQIEVGLVNGYAQDEVLPFARAKYNSFFVAPGYEKGAIVGLVVGKEFNF
jgi:hypothetical protein